MIIRLLPVAVAVCCCWTLLGCSAGEQRPPVVPAVPSVEAPKGLVGLDPCTLVDGAAMTELDLGTGVPGTDDLGANCRWEGGKRVSVRLTAYTSGAGLTDLTERMDPAARRVRLSGYPAVETFTTGGDFCRYDVGVAEQAAIVATMDGGEPDSCTVLQKLLGAVLSRLPVSDQGVIGTPPN